MDEKMNMALKLEIKNEKVIVNAPAEYSFEFLGADFPQIVDDNYNIHTPLTDVTVTLSFACNHENRKAEVDIPLLIKGEHSALCASKPKTIPEVAQWFPSGTGKVKACDIKAISFSDDAIMKSVAVFTEEYNNLLDASLIAEKRKKTERCAIHFETDKDLSYLGEEGYIIKADKNGLIAAASNKVGIVWAGKTILQLLVQSGFPYGEMRDYPKYPVRGFMLDVGRRPMSIEMLKKFVKFMSWYKMNDFQLHLSDNHIFLENYSDNGDASTFEAYEAFRLESSIKNKDGETAAAKDYHYSKKDFRDFISWSEERGVRIVPEIDVPAHALSFTKVFPEYMVKNKTSPLMDKRPLTDHLDVSKPETTEFIKNIFDDYTAGENPVFPPNVTVHIGADEFLTDYGAYRAFINELVPHIKKTNPVRMWGGLTWIKDEPPTPIIPEAIQNVQMNLWSKDWADGREMYDMGYELINTIDHYLYMVPNGTQKRGSYTDLLNKSKVFKNFEPNRVRLKDKGRYIDLPAGDKRILGAAFAIWHDNIDKRASGLAQSDTLDRFLDSAPLMSEKTWGSCTDKKSASQVDSAADAIGTPYGGEMHTDGSFVFSSLSLNKAKLSQSALVLEGGESFAETGIESLPPGIQMIIDIEFNEVKPGQIIMESDALFGSPYDIRITDNGKLGFNREGYEYEFDFALPAGKRIQLNLVTKPLKTVLKKGLFSRKRAYGRFVHNGMVKKVGIKNSTLSVPCMRIGSKSNSVKAKVYGISYKAL